jgi:hypothetical protein
MAAVPTQGIRTVPGADQLQPIDLALDNAYPTGGYPLTAKTFNLTVLRRLIACRPRNVASAIYTPVPIVTVGSTGIITGINLALLVASTGLQVANGVDVSAASFHLIAEGN